MSDASFNDVVRERLLVLWITKLFNGEPIKDSWLANMPVLEDWEIDCGTSKTRTCLFAAGLLRSKKLKLYSCEKVASPIMWMDRHFHFVICDAGFWRLGQKHVDEDRSACWDRLDE